MMLPRGAQSLESPPGVIDAITQAQGATEVLTLDGVSFEAPRKTWAHPIELRDGTWGVPWDARLRAVEGRAATIRGDAVAVPRETEKATLERAESIEDASVRTRA